MKILITGGAGFVGLRTANALAKGGHDVRVLDVLHPQIHGIARTFPATLASGVERVYGDVRNMADVSQALENVEAVFHFAAHTGVGQSMYDLREYTDVNCTGTATLLEALIKKKMRLRRFVLASSRAVYGEGSYECPRHGRCHPEPRKREQLEQGRFDMLCAQCGERMISLPTDETTAPLPASIYAWTKRQQEILCGYAADTFGMPVTILRYFNVYGAGQSLKNPYTGVVSVFYNRLNAGQPIALYEQGMPLRDFVHVADVVRANVAALEREVPTGRCFNIGSGQALGIRHLAESLGRVAKRNVQLVDHGEYRAGDIFSCVADISQARKWLGYKPTVGLAEGLAEFVRWAETQEGADDYETTVGHLRMHGLFGEARRRKSA